MIEYEGYVATVEVDQETGIFHGEVVNTRAVITCQGRSVEALRRALAESVEDYLEWCAECGKEPEKPQSVERFTSAVDTPVDPGTDRR